MKTKMQILERTIHRDGLLQDVANKWAKPRLEELSKREVGRRSSLVMFGLDHIPIIEERVVKKEIQIRELLGAVDKTDVILEIKRNKKNRKVWSIKTRTTNQLLHP